MNWRNIFGRRHNDEDLAAEIDSYIEHEIQEHPGLSRDEARNAAHRKFGNRTLIQEEIYRMNRFGTLETFWQDLRYAVRLLRKSPGFTAVAVLSLAAGIGVNTAMFSVINTVLFRSLPYPRAGRLVCAKRDVTLPEYDFWKQHNHCFSSISAYTGNPQKHLTSTTGDEWIRTLVTGTDFLKTLGIPLAFGREFTDDETHRNGPIAIILTDALWRRRFGADPNALGRTVMLDDQSYTIAGVLPPNYWFTSAADALVPLQPSGTISDTGTNTSLIARLNDGVTLKQAQAEMPILAENYRTANRLGSEYHPFTVISYADYLTGDVRTNLFALFGATALLLLIACSNLAALLLTRCAARRKELAVRLALGSSRERLLMQFFIENVLIAVLGASAGLAAAYALLKGLVAWIPFDLPSSSPIALDGSVLFFTTVVAILTALAFTLVPLAASNRLNLLEALHSAGRSAAGAIRARARNVLVVGEIALATLLLIAAGLLIQSLERMYQERLGFAPQGLTVFQTPFAVARQKNYADASNFTETLLAHLQAIPGVQGAAATNVIPLVRWYNYPTQREGRPDQSIGGMEVRYVTPSYFDLMGIPLRRGRSFTGQDTPSSTPVIMVNETLAKQWWQGGDPTSDRLIIGAFRGKVFGENVPRQVIGVIADVKTRLTQTPWPTVFVPISQTEKLEPHSLFWIVRSTGSPTLGETLRRTVLSIDPTQRVLGMRAMDEIVSSSTASSRFNASLFGIFAGVALALAATGVYGLLSFVVAQRKQEIGTRMALGATGMDVLTLFLRQGIALAATGLAIGVAAAYFLTRWLESLLYSVKTHDFLTFAAASIVLFLAALIAIYIPARRAAKTDPILALRYE